MLSRVKTACVEVAVSSLVVVSLAFGVQAPLAGAAQSERPTVEQIRGFLEIYFDSVNNPEDYTEGYAEYMYAMYFVNPDHAFPYSLASNVSPVTPGHLSQCHMAEAIGAVVGYAEACAGSTRVAGTVLVGIHIPGNDPRPAGPVVGRERVITVRAPYDNPGPTVMQFIYTLDQPDNLEIEVTYVDYGLAVTPV